MNITFIVGNGFDCGLGLGTDYRRFIKWYLQQPESDKESVQKMRSIIKGDIDTWADAEMAMAALPFSEFGGDVRNVAMECAHDFSGHLSEYIKSKERLALLPQKRSSLAQLQKQFGKFFLDIFYDGDLCCFPWGNVPKNGVVYINVVSLNYSNILDRLLPRAPVDYRDPETGNVCVIKFLPVCHLHGEINAGTQSLSFGVGYEDQIIDANLRRYSSRFGYLLKPKYDTEFNYGKYMCVQKKIRESECVVIFGTSLGRSDLYLWIMMLQEFFRNQRLGGSMRILYSAFESKYEGIPETADFQAKTDGMFCKYLDEYGEMPGMRDDLMDAVFTVGVGPYKSPDGTTAFFDPLRLTWLKRELKIV